MQGLVGHRRVFVFSERGWCLGKVLSRGGAGADLVCVRSLRCLWRLDWVVGAEVGRLGGGGESTSVV